MSTSYNSQIQSMIPTYCPSCPPSLVSSLVQTESSGNPNAVSPAGAIGLFQLMPATAASLGVNPSDPTQNIQGGLTYLQQLYNQYGNWTDALEAYNEGPGNLASQFAAGVTPTSAGYASGILAGAGISDDAADSLGLPSDDSSDSSITASISSLFDNPALDSLSDSTGLSGSVLAAIGIGMFAAAAWAFSR